MRRRDLLVGLAAVSLATRAMAEERPQITILHSGFPNLTPIDRLFEALRDLGYENGRTAAIDLLAGEGDRGRLKVIVAELAAKTPDVVIAITSPAVLALKSVGISSPVVFAFVPDPVGLGIVSSLAHPGGNFTGVTYSEPVLGGKRLELLLDALPNLKRIAVLWSRMFPENLAVLKSVRESAAAHGIELISCEMGGVDDLAAAFDNATRSGAQAAVFITDNALFGHRKEVAQLALTHHLPSIHSFEPEVRDGGLMAFGPQLGWSYQRAAALAGRILKGARPADLPVEEPTAFSLVINGKTAAALGIAFPPAILLRADEVIE
jgi:putative tryptophan/tyrosine transport system substrate-binding protein